MSTTTTERAIVLEKGAVGRSIPRKEDKRLVQGEGVFFDDERALGGDRRLGHSAAALIASTMLT